MKKLLLLLAVGISGYASAQTPLYFGTYDASEIEVIDTTGGSYTLSSTLAVTDDQGGAVDGIYGLSLDPTSGIMYVVHGPGDGQNSPDRTLGTIDLTTGVITEIGNAGNITDICFVGSTLYANLGNSGGFGLVTVDITDATTTPFTTVGGSFSYGHSLAWNYSDSTIFRTDESSSTYFEIDPSTGVVTDLAPATYPSGSDYTSASTLLNDSTMLVSDGVEIYEVNLNDYTFVQIYTGANDGHALAFGAYPFLTNTYNGKSCSNEAMLGVSESGSTYQWYENGLAMNNETNETLYPTFSGSPSVTNSYYCKVDGDSSLAIELTLIWAPAASFTAVPDTVDLGTDPSGLVAFTNTSTGGNMYSWDFGSGFFSTNENPSFSFLTVGTSNIEFIVSKPNGCSDTAWATVTVINTTSISELSSDFSVYPNPVSDVLTITMNNGGGDYTVELMDVSGRIIEQRIINNASDIKFDMSNNISGFYFVRVFNNNEEQNFKILKK